MPVNKTCRKYETISWLSDRNWTFVKIMKHQMLCRCLFLLLGMLRTNFTNDIKPDNNINMTRSTLGNSIRPDNNINMTRNTLGNSIRPDDSDNLHDKLNCYLIHCIQWLIQTRNTQITSLTQHKMLKRYWTPP